MKIGVIGTGSIGAFVGGRLAARGNDVVFVGRERQKKELTKTGMHLTDLDGADARVAAEALHFETEPSALSDCDVVMVAVKSAQTEEVATSLAAVLPKNTVVVSLQNGVRNADLLRAKLSEHVVLDGIVGFNVVARENGVFRRATTGQLVFKASEDPRVIDLARALRDAGFDVVLSNDIRGQQWAKLMMNLNNAVSALSDVPTRELILSGGYRRVLRSLVSEALFVLSAAGIKPARLGAIPVRLFPVIMRLPAPILAAVARAQLKIDPEARSSMWEDLTRGRPTEVDFLNGEIVRLAASVNVKAPLNERITALVHEAEKENRGSPALSADALWQKLTE